MSKREKTLMIGVLILFSLLVVKSMFLDEVKNLEGAEQEFKYSIEKVLEEKYSEKTTTKLGILKRRIVKITPLTSSELENMKEYSLGYEYKAKVRTYIIGIIPISDKTYMKINEGGNNE